MDNEATIVDNAKEFLNAELIRLHMNEAANERAFPAHERLVQKIANGMTDVSDFGFRTVGKRFSVDNHMNGPGITDNGDGTRSINIKLTPKKLQKAHEHVTVTFTCSASNTEPTAMTTTIAQANETSTTFTLRIDANKNESAVPDIYTFSVFGLRVPHILAAYGDVDKRKGFLMTLEPYYDQKAQFRFSDQTDSQKPPIDFSGSGGVGYEYESVFSIHPEDPEYENICAALYAELGSLKR